MFPGQGSQRAGMGTELFARYPARLAAADRILGYSLADLCRHDPEGRLNLTQYTQPALYVVNALAYEQRLEEGARTPEALVGHSLGEYNALLAAGVFDFETGLRLVQKRGELMSAVNGGGMAAVVGLDSDGVRRVLAEQALDALDIANLNSPVQTVVAGPAADIERAAACFERYPGVRYVPLRVSAAFHSRFMQAAQTAFEHFLAGVNLRPPRVLVMANASAEPYGADAVGALLARQLSQPVRWQQCIEALLRRGANEFVEVGPGNVLTGLVRAIRQAFEPGAAAVLPGPAAVQPSASVRDASLPKHAETVAPRPGPGPITAESLGSAAFRADYGVRYAYVAGAMYKGIASKDMVARLGRAGLLGYLGTGGMSLEHMQRELALLQGELSHGEPYGVNLLCNLHHPQLEERCVDLLLRAGVRNVEAAAFMQMTPALVRYRLSGLRRRADGRVEATHRVLAKASRPEVAEAFMSPAPERIVRALVASGALTAEQAELGRELPMAHDICVESDSGGHTDQGVALVLLPTMQRLAARVMAQRQYAQPLRVGAAGGLGAPEAIAAMFLMGADFVLTGSINQCTVEAGTSAAVRDILAGLDVQDTTYAPAGDMFEIGAKVQVVKRGLFFAARANKLYQLYRQYDALEQIDAETRRLIEERYFQKTFEQVWDETRAYYARVQPDEVVRAESNPKHKLALLFRWYFVHSSRLALAGDTAQRLDYQIHSGPAIGAFNRWVAGTPLADWRQRHVDDIAKRLMVAAAEFLDARLRALCPPVARSAARGSEA
jgi:trans-AT polyketide synthase/acyltransferase/oxidoreductase domain-containing protein